MKKLIVCLAVLSFIALSVAAQTQNPANFAQRTSGLQRQDGFLPIYLDAARGRVLMEVPKLNQEMIYFVTVAKGVGSVELGIDRGASSGSRLGVFEGRGGGPVLRAKKLRYCRP